jgi:hypothetical protein
MARSVGYISLQSHSTVIDGTSSIFQIETNVISSEVEEHRWSKPLEIAYMVTKCFEEAASGQIIICGGSICNLI